MKNTVEMAEIIKGCAHPRRITMMMVMKGSKSHLSLSELSEQAEVPYKTASVHLETLRDSGLITKTRYGARTEHALTPLGEEVLEFLTCL